MSRVLTRGPYTAPWQTVHWDGENPGPGPKPSKARTSASTSPGAASTAATTRPIGGPSTTRASGSTRLSESRDRRARRSAARLAECIDGNHLSPCARQAHGRGYRRTGRQRAGLPTGARPIRGTSQFMWRRTGRLRFFDAETPRTRKVALRSAITFSPTPGNAFAIFSQPGAAGPRRHTGQWPPVCLLDSRSRFCPRH